MLTVLFVLWPFGDVKKVQVDNMSSDCATYCLFVELLPVLELLVYVHESYLYGIDSVFSLQKVRLRELLKLLGVTQNRKAPLQALIQSCMYLIRRRASG